MKVKELSITANITWSPEHVMPIYLACGTSAQQLDPSFNSSSVLQLYDLNPNNGTLEMNLAVTKNVPAKFNKILWNGKPEGVLSQPSGVIVGGCDNGSVYIYSADKLLKKMENPLVISMEGKHLGPVSALDFNHHQPNLLATGSSECEIIIWDVNNTSSPMTPGAKPSLSSDVTAIAWNKQVEHIMASTYAGRCVVYDLRKSSSIIQIAESVSRIKAHSVRWHPAVATQLILGSDDDSAPFGQVWDLRFAAAPLKTLEGHQRGIMATSWCSADPDLFITSAKDNKIYVWNPNNAEKQAEMVGEFPSYNQWSFDLSWCPKDPSLVAASSVDSTVSVYSIIGAGIPPAQNNKFSAIADSFPGMEMPTEVPETAQPQSIYLKHPPKWLPKRCGASFGFGGRLLTWNASERHVSISQVVTETEFVSRSAQLEDALSKADLASFCRAKSSAIEEEREKTLWNFIGATFEPSIRSSYMTLLGFTPDQVAAKVRPNDLVISPEELADKMASLRPNGQDGSTSSLDPSEQFEMIASAHSADKTPEAELEPNFECLPAEAMTLAAGEDSSGMIRHALLVGDFQSAVQLCLKEKKNSLALILAAHSGTELFNKTRDQVLKSEPQSGLSPLVSSVVQQDLQSVVSQCQLGDWKEALIATLTYAPEAEFGALVESLGERLQSEGSASNLHNAVLCFLCAGNLDKFVSCLAKTKANFSDASPSDLQDLVEIMVVLERALSAAGRPANLKDGSSASVYLCNYASLLASQGALSTAVSYLNNPTQSDMIDLRDRLYQALGYPTGTSLAARNRTVSASSQQSYRRSSTPLSYQHAFPLCANVASVAKLVPAQYTPSVQAQQATYGAPQTAYAPPQNAYGAPQNNFYSPPAPPKQQHSFMQPTASVPPTFGGTSLVPPTQFTPSSSVASSALAPPLGPSPSGTNAATGGFRRLNAPARYVTEPSSLSSRPGGVFTPSPNPPRQSVQPNTHFPHFNPAAPSASPLVGASAGLPPPPIGPNSPSFMPEPSEAVGNAVTPAAFDANVPRGWNDPPPLSSARRAKQRLKGQPGDAPAGPVPGMMVPEPQMQAQQQQFPGFQQPFHAKPADPMNRGTVTPGSSMAPQPQIPQPPAPQMPLPAEHQVIQDVFNRLREKCLQVTVNPTAKQRLADLNNKLEILYDKLRNGQIGANTTGGLHEIVGAVKSGDYHRALQLHSATINSGNFSEMSQFMPSVKILLTTCMQCQVFYD